jgi:hypothetical protein
MGLYIQILELLIQDRTRIVYFSALDHHIYESPGLYVMVNVVVIRLRKIIGSTPCRIKAKNVILTTIFATFRQESSIK